MKRLLASLLLLAMSAAPAGAERLTMSLSSHRVVISSNFTGAEVVLFGAIGQDRASVSRPGGYDLVVILSGPERDITVRRKESILGFWVNWGAQLFRRVPQYLAILSTGPLDDIAPPPVQRRLKLDLADYIAPSGISEPGEAARIAEEQAALIRLKKSERLFIANPTGITFLNDNLFRANIILPANVPIGAFEVSVHLLSGGTPLAVQTSALEVVKEGFEADIADFSRTRPWTYGLVAALLALACGWLASVAFRRD